MPRKSMRWQADLPPTASRPRRRPRDFSPRWRKLTLMYQTVGLGQCAGFGRRQLSYIFFLALGVTSSIVLVGPVLRQHWHGMEKSCLAAWLDGVDHRDAGPLYKSASIEGRGYAGIRSRSTRRRHRRRRALRRAKKTSSLLLLPRAAQAVAAWMEARPRLRRGCGRCSPWAVARDFRISGQL
jgi:hypothetical protein